MASRVVRVDGPHGLQGPQVTVIARPQLGCKPSMSLAVGSAPARLFDFTSGQFNKEQRLPGVSCGKLVASRQRCENTKATQSTLEWTVDWEKWSNNMVLRGDSGKGRTVKSPKAGPCKDSWFAFVFLLPGPCEASTSLFGLWRPRVEGLCFQRCPALRGSLGGRMQGGRAFGQQLLHHLPVPAGCRTVQRGLTSADGDRVSAPLKKSLGTPVGGESAGQAHSPQ